MTATVDLVAQSILSVGYEGRTAEELASALCGRGVVALVDVRLNAVSRKRGLSKRGLADTLADTGIDYVHLRNLGNPIENRAGFARRDPLAAEHFRELLQVPEAQEQLAMVLDLLNLGTIAVLCYERDDMYCHRHVIIQELQAMAPGHFFVARV